MLPKRRRFRGQVYDRAQLNVFLAAALQSPAEAAFVLAASYGLRRSECAGLRWSAIDFRARRMVINHTAILSNGRILYVDNVKTRSSYRTLPLNLEAVQLIGALPHDSLYLFPNQNGEPHSPNSWSQKLGRCMHRLNEAHPEVPILTAHELRHTYGTYLRRHGADIYTIQKLLGHKDINVTAEIYVHNELNTLREAVTALENRAAAAK